MCVVLYWVEHEHDRPIKWSFYIPSPSKTGCLAADAASHMLQNGNIQADSSVQALKKYLHISTIMWKDDHHPAKEHFSALPVQLQKHRRDGPQLMFTVICYS